MEVRHWRAADREACLALFDSNTPDTFQPHERVQFEQWLESAPANYFVMEHEGTTVACGGYALSASAPGEARLIWGIVGRQWQRMGLGRFLLMYRLREISKSGEQITTVSLGTNQRAVPFFLSQGFRVVHVTTSGHSPAVDKVEMVRKIAVCS